MTTTDKLPPLAEVFHREAQKRLVEGSRLQAKSSPDWPFEQTAAGCWQQAEVLAAPYDALIRQQEARIAELEAEVAPFRELAREAHESLGTDTLCAETGAEDLGMRLAARHKEE